MTNPVGLHIQAQNFTEAEEQALYAHCAKAQYATCTVMDNYKVAMNLVTVMPNCVVVFRDSNYEPSPQNPGDFAWWLQAHNKPDPRSNKIVLMVNCEQGFGADRCEMWAWMIREAHKQGRKLCVGNTSAGTPHAGMAPGEPNEWLLAKPVFEALRDCGGYLGVHEYTGFFTWSNVNGRSPIANYLSRPAAIDWTQALWHLGRLIAIKRACDQLGLPCPTVIITEGFIDNMGDIEKYFNVKSDGWQLLIPFWAEKYPGIDPEEFLADNHIWAWEKIYAVLGFILGVHIYTYGDANGYRWRNYRVDKSYRYLARMEKYHPTQTPSEEPPVTMQGAIALDDPRWETGTIKPIDGTKTVLLRATPGTTQKAIGSLTAARPVKYIFQTGYNTWAQVYFTDTNEYAWITTLYTAFTKDVVVEPPPVEPPPEIPPQEYCLHLYFQEADPVVVKASLAALAGFFEQMSLLSGGKAQFTVE